MVKKKDSCLLLLSVHWLRTHLRRSSAAVTIKRAFSWWRIGFLVGEYLTAVSGNKKEPIRTRLGFGGRAHWRGIPWLAS